MFRQNISTDDIIYITIKFKKEPWEGGKGGSRLRLSLRAGILELRFHKVKIRISLSNCWT